MKKEIQQITEQEDAIKRKLIAKILEQPQNPDIQPVKNDKVKAFTISSSIMFSHNLVMSPFYYDWREQATFIAELVENGRSLYSSMNMLQKIATTHKIRVHNNTYVFHPSVCERLKEIIS